jgi:hypothetical protein
MKLTLLQVLNGIGLRGASDKALYAANLLKIATISSPQVTVTPEIPAILAKPEVIAQTAKEIRLATPIVPAAQNTTGFTFGQLYLNSPAYPAGTQIPAIPQKPASAEVIGVAAVIGVPKVPAVISPKIDALKGWEDAIQINKSATNIEVIAYLPYASSPLLIGAPTNGIGSINEMTQPALTVNAWLDTKSSNTPGTATAEPITTEQYFYKHALEIVAKPGSTSTIQNSSRVVNGVVVPCKKVTLQLTAIDYIPALESLQLPKLVA